MYRLRSFLHPFLLTCLLLFVCGAAYVFAQSATPAATATANPATVAAPAAASPIEAAADPAAVAATETFLDILMKGGALVMIPLAILSFVALLLIIFYFFTIRQGTVVSDKFMNAADALIRKQDYLGLIAVCNRENECIARIVHKALDFATKNPTASFDEVREVTEAEGSRQASILNQRIIYLADIGKIAPMVGLLGTVIGMIKAFNNIGVGVQQMELAPGVSQALITTATGLVIGIPSMIFYSIFRGKVQKLIAEMEAAATHIMALLAAQYKRANYRASARRSERDAEAGDYGGSHEPRSL
ncbi:MAG: MotA/TolQ/ExbB proton channel family protein [Verrucomicrobiales bacterium]|nr:MotA/TolQ/ExbB proton channel family protein [Verrucomicrobiales bacterium]